MQFSYLLLLLMQASIVFGIRFFHLGRRRGGNLRPPHYEGDLPPAQWFKQRLDHFTPTDMRMWKQRYFINNSFYDFNNPGPVFLMIGGEGPANPNWMVTGAWIDYAKKFNALCINLEHRYYGESHPTEDLNTKNLQYLSSHQALADLANFITAISNKLKINKEVRWIAFGGSYPGSLAAWLRMKYPHLIYAAVSSSGPLLAKVNFMEYFQVVVNALKEKTGSDECVEQVKEAHKQIKLLAQTNTETLDSVFNLCQPLAQASSSDKRNFYSSLADDFAGLVQYNEDNRIGADPLYRNMTINTVCNLLTEPGTTAAFKKLGAFNSMMLSENKQPCLDYSYQNMVDELKNTSWNAAEGGRQWMYQTCTEFGFYQTSSGAADVFGDQFALDFFVQQCQDVFGTKFSKSFLESAAEWTNSAYGALDIQVERVVFVHGSVDPWHALGVTATREHGAPAVYIKGTAHCANMYPPSERDLPELKRARVEIQDYLAGWLSRP